MTDAKPTSQQVPGVEPLSADDADAIIADHYRHAREDYPLKAALKCLAFGSHVVISATELSALRAREERLRALANDFRAYGRALGPHACADELESILNEGKT